VNFIPNHFKNLEEVKRLQILQQQSFIWEEQWRNTLLHQHENFRLYSCNRFCFRVNKRQIIKPSDSFESKPHVRNVLFFCLLIITGGFGGGQFIWNSDRRWQNWYSGTPKGKDICRCGILHRFLTFLICLPASEYSRAWFVHRKKKISVICLKRGDYVAYWYYVKIFGYQITHLYEYYDRYIWKLEFKRNNILQQTEHLILFHRVEYYMDKKYIELQ
jgi:hypothetical protein